MYPGAFSYFSCLLTPHSSRSIRNVFEPTLQRLMSKCPRESEVNLHKYAIAL